MNRISHLFPDVDTLLDGLRRERPVEALVVDRVGLIDLLRRSLTELHEHRRRVAGTPAEPATVHRIKYWDDVLGWLKEQHGTTFAGYMTQIGDIAIPFESLEHVPNNPFFAPNASDIPQLEAYMDGYLRELARG